MAVGGNKAGYLANVPMFSGLSPQELEQIDRASDELEFEPGAELVTEGRVGREFFLILDGEATVERAGQEVATLAPGQWFGELSLLDKGPRSATVKARAPMKVLVLGQREFAGLLETVPGMAAKMLAPLAERLRQADAATVTY
jgi:CRP/FNR family transcriptional regulator, cyclic AMP receptor protein